MKTPVFTPARSGNPCLQRPALLAASALLSALLLGGCYVVPITQPVPGGAMVVPASPAAAQPLQFPARLYPANDAAARYGIVMGQVTNDLQGRGVFTAQIAGESFSGEATRSSGSRTGTANGAGSRGSYLACTYTMNSATQGTGRCRLNNGAEFAMHVGM